MTDIQIKATTDHFIYQQKFFFQIKFFSLESLPLAICKPSWLLTRPTIDQQFCESYNAYIALFSARVIFYVNNFYNDYLHLYADGSKSRVATSATSFVFKFNVRQSIRINNNSSVFTAELYAILQALYWIVQSRQNKHLILSDCVKLINKFSEFFRTTKT